jgi:hypothetical protein
VESRSNRFRVVREDATNTACHNTLLENDLPRVVTRGIEERNDLMVSLLSLGVLAIANGDRPLCHVDVRPLYSTNLGLAHCSGDCKPNNPPERYELLGI